MRRAVLKSRRSLVLAATLLALLPVLYGVHAQPATGDFGVSSPMVWRAWTPWVLGCGNGDAHSAIEYLRMASAIVRKADAKLERDATTEAFRKKAIKSMEDFDLKGFYKLLPNQEGDYRSFSVQGAPTASSYKVVVAKGNGFQVHADSKRRAFGDSSGTVRMRKLTGGDDDHYLLKLESGVGLGQLSWPAVIDGLKDAARLVNAYDQGELPLVMKAADKFLQKTQPKLSERERRLLAGLWGSYPRLSELLVPLSQGEDLIDESKSTADLVRINAVSRWNVKAFKKAYPKLADYFEDLKDVAAIKLWLVDGNGNTLFDLDANTKRMQAHVSLYLRDGKIVPTRNGEPKLDVAPRFDTMTLYMNLHFVLHRVHLYVDGIKTEMRFREHASGAELTTRANKMPKVRVEGAAFGFIPTGMVDWFIPGDLAGLTTRMLKVALAGNEGRGIVTRARFEGSANKLATYDFGLETELLDNALVRFGMKVVSDRAIPDEGQEEDIRRFAVDYRDAFDADLARFAKFGVAAANEQAAAAR